MLSEIEFSKRGIIMKIVVIQINTIYSSRRAVKLCQ